jgi:hypothetical protein
MTVLWRDLFLSDFSTEIDQGYLAGWSGAGKTGPGSYSSSAPPRVQFQSGDGQQWHGRKFQPEDVIVECGAYWNTGIRRRWGIFARATTPYIPNIDVTAAPNSGYTFVLANDGNPTIHRNGLPVLTGTAMSAISNDTNVRMKMQVEGSRVRAKWWISSDTEPNWMLDWTDPTPLAGKVCGFGVSNSGNRPTQSIGPFTTESINDYTDLRVRTVRSQHKTDTCNSFFVLNSVSTSVPGDLLYLNVFSGASVTPPAGSGWIPNDDKGWHFWRRVTSAEPVTWTFQTQNTSRHAVVLTVIADADDPDNYVDTTGSIPIVPAITTSGPNRAILGVMMNGAGNSSADVTFPTEMDGLLNTAANGGSSVGRRIVTSWKDVPVAGTYGPFASSSSASSWWNRAVVLREVPTTGEPGVSYGHLKLDGIKHPLRRYSGSGDPSDRANWVSHPVRIYANGSWR